MRTMSQIAPDVGWLGGVEVGLQRRWREVEVVDVVSSALLLISAAAR